MIYNLMAAVGQIGALIKAADVSVELLWPDLLAEALVSIHQLGGLICNWGRGQELESCLQAVLRRREWTSLRSLMTWALVVLAKPLVNVSNEKPKLFVCKLIGNKEM